MGGQYPLLDRKQVETILKNIGFTEKGTVGPATLNGKDMSTGNAES